MHTERHDSGDIDQGIADTLAAVKRLVEVGRAPAPRAERWVVTHEGATASGLAVGRLLSSPRLVTRVRPRGLRLKRRSRPGYR
jgi:hypothetical protein